VAKPIVNPVHDAGDAQAGHRVSDEDGIGRFGALDVLDRRFDEVGQVQLVERPRVTSATGQVDGEHRGSEETDDPIPAAGRVAGAMDEDEHVASRTDTPSLVRPA
jgi:hypothetical protein